MQETAWYYVHEGKQCGPVTHAELVHWLLEGRLDRDVLVWRDGLTEWVRASDVRRSELLELDAAVPPRTPPLLSSEPLPASAVPSPRARGQMEHAQFVRLKREGRAGLRMDDGTARSLVENHPRMPARYRSAHTFWAWVWLLTAVISCGVIPMLLGMRHAINKSAREFVLEFAEQDAAFYEEGLGNQWFTVVAR